MCNVHVQWGPEAAAGELCIFLTFKHNLLRAIFYDPAILFSCQISFSSFRAAVELLVV